MLLLTDVTHSLELVTGGSQSVDWQVSWVDISSAGVTGGSADGNVASATTTEIAPEPAASTTRQIKHITAVNKSGSDSVTVKVQKDVGGTERVVTPTVTLQAGECLQYVDGQGFKILDANGREKVSGSISARIPTVMMPVLRATANLTGTKTITSGSSFAVYVGKAPRSLSSAQVRFRVTTGMGTITWGEMAIAKGSVNVGGNPILTVVGYADISAVANGTGQKTVTVNVSSGQSINEGDDLWVVIGNQATTACVVRALSIADDLQVGLQASLATRPSLNVGVGQSYTIEGATTLAMWCAMVT